MASETAAVLVAVRVRPLNSRESPLECTITVPDSRTVTLTDITGSGQQHCFTFDKIFWSVPPNVLPVQSSASSNITSSSLYLTPPTRSPRLSCVDSLTPMAVSRSASIVGGVGYNNNNNCVSSAASTIAGLTNTTNNNNNNESSLGVIAGKLVAGGALPCFTRVPEYDDQASVYAFIGPRMYESVMTGYNSCLFAYGQTGSGKTHSMMGPTDGVSLRSTERGIMPRLCEDLFEMMRREREEDESVTYNVECSFLEIYCERVRDLLAHTGASHTFSATNTTHSTISGSSTAGLGFASNNNNNNPSSGVGGIYHGGISSASSPSSLRIRQHPTRGPYVEGLSLVKVSNAEGVMRQLIGGLRERVTAETKMNEHSSRSHAILQLHITRVTVVREETAVVTKTRVCKVNMVDLAGSERVSQSGATGDRFEEARNINLSLTTLGRVILQLSDKQAGKNVVPGYRDSVLTWLLSDSLGGNSKTIMLATIAPSAYCYQQTLNTLRFAGVTKKVINVATVNEDRHFQKLIATLRQQIVKLTLQLEEGKAAEVHHEEIRALRRDRDELESQIDSMRASMLTMVPASDVTSLQRRITDLEEANKQLHKEKNQLQRQFISTTTSLREELAQKRGEIMKLHESLVEKDGELQEWRRRNREETVRRETSPPQQQQFQQEQAEQQQQQQFHQQQKKQIPIPIHRQTNNNNNNNNNNNINSRNPPPPPLILAEPSRRREELERQVETLTRELRGERQRREELERAKAGLHTQLTSLQSEKEEALRELSEVQHKFAEKAHALDCTQSDLAATRTLLRVERGGKSTAEREKEFAAQLEQARAEYLREKQTNVDLLLRVSKVEQKVSRLKKGAITKARDIAELEQLLLEETETSERYYLRLRYYREVLNMSMSFLRESFTTFGSQNTDLTNISSFKNNNTTNDKNSVITLLWEQAVCDCARNEAYSRVLLEQDYLSSLLDLLGQKALLQQLTVASTNEEMLTLRAATAEAAEEPERLRQKVENIENELAQTVAERITLQATLRNSENNRERLTRQVEELTTQLTSLQESNDSLIAKIVDIQASRDNFDVRSEDVSASSETYQQQWQQPQLQNQQQQQQERREHKEEQKQQQLEGQVSNYQEQVGVLHAQLEKERNDHAEMIRLVHRERDELLREIKSVREECKASLKESMQIVKDYEVRIKELQELVATLRNALEEESNNADNARDQMQRAELEKREALEELKRVNAAKDAIEFSRDATERRFAELEQQLHELQVVYHDLERRLTGMKLQESDVYLTLEREGDDQSWMEKAQREKEALERQRRDVRRLNEELLAMVRQRNESLREVHRQITKMQSGGASPNVSEAKSINNDSPLGAQLRND